MWWLNPGKEVLQILFNRILAPYVENLDLNQVNYGIGQGQLTLRNLRLKKGALDKFQLPVDVAEGRLGRFTLSLHWMNLGSRPVEILIEDIYLIVVPSPQTPVDPAEEEARTQAAKAERLENAELLQSPGQAVAQSEEMQSQGLWQSLIAKVINNIQITIRNLHVRYEDNMSVPGHPFSAGLMLAEFTTVSVNNQWQPAFIESTAGAIHKLATLNSLAVYFDTDTTSLAGLPAAEIVQQLSEMIDHGDAKYIHQYMLKPVSGEGKITVNQKSDSQSPRYDVQLIFDEIGVALDNDQYRDIISLADMYHVYLRRRLYGKFQPGADEYTINPARARLRFALTAILEEVKEKRRRWTWDYFASRRDERNRYVDLFQRKLLGALGEGEPEELAALERKLSYEDLRFYRSIARSRIRKDEALRKRIETERNQQAQTKSWTSWLWGSTASTSQEEATFGNSMTNEQRKQLYEILDFDEKTALAESLQMPRDSLKMRLSTRLRKGSMSLIDDPHGKCTEVISVIFNVFQAKFLQRLDNFEVAMSLGALSVHDGTTKGSLYPEIVRVRDEVWGYTQKQELISSEGYIDVDRTAFFYLNYENNPLDERADNALTVRMRHMEIIYHKGYIEAIHKFFKPPASQLESVEALLDAAGQTLEGIRRETRAVLEYALETHKTIDIQMDLNAPVIIVPEDVTTHSCKHLFVDAGHIAVESKLVDKKDVRAVQQKRQQVYNEEDHKNLESLMYDTFLLRLEDAQFILGDNLQACRDALLSSSTNSLHLLERINIDLRIQNSIVPSISRLARFKVSGALPHLKINFSDYKYKALMRIVDISIPRFAEESQSVVQHPANIGGGFPLSPNLFGQTGVEYYTHDDDGIEENAREREPESPKTPIDLRQRIIEIDFRADVLCASLAKMDLDTTEMPLGDVTLTGFALKLAAAKYEMTADVKLRSLSMTLVQPGKQPLNFMSSPESSEAENKGLLNVRYIRVQRESSDFAVGFDGIEQQVVIELSTFIFLASPEPLISLYDFIMSTFVYKGPEVGVTAAAAGKQSVAVSDKPSGKIQVKVELATVQVSLIDGTIGLATLSLSTADMAVLLQANTVQISGRLGNLKVTNDDKNYIPRPEFQELLSIEGDNFADFSYQTFDPNEERQQVVKSLMTLNAASIKVNFLQGPLRGVFVFFLRLARLKGLYDAATQVAVQQAPAIERMQFEVCIKSPIIVFPSDPSHSPDAFTLRLGEASASNTIENGASKIKASLNGIQLVSSLLSDGEMSTLKIVDKIDISSDIVQLGPINRTQDIESPDTQAVVKVSDVELSLTQTQYRLLMDLAKSIPRIFSNYPNDVSDNSSRLSEQKSAPMSNLTPSVSLGPELKIDIGQRAWTMMDVVLTIDSVRLQLYDASASCERNLKDHGVARFALRGNALRLKMLSNNSLEAQVTLKSFTISNTRPGNTKFREIIPAAQHNRNQFTILYSASGDNDGSSLAILTVDSPRIVFAVDPVIAILELFTSAFSASAPAFGAEQGSLEAVHQNDLSAEKTFNYRLDLHDASISVLENDADSNSQALELTIKHILLSHQVILALNVDSLGMSLTRMGKASERAKFLDDTDVTLSLDRRNSASEQWTNIDILCQPVIFRVSYRDILLITSVVNKAMESYRQSQKSRLREDNVINVAPESPQKGIGKPSSASISTGKTRVAMIKEQLKCSIEGFSLILIGDLQEQPLLHLKVKPFIVGAQDWSGELHATTSITSHISFWNLTNSHWEPFIDPWALTFSISREGASGGMNFSLTSRERLDLNLSAAFISLVLTAMKLWNKEGAYVLQKSRGTYAPYRIRNCTGYAVYIWSDASGSGEVDKTSIAKLSSGEVLDWRFDDWQTTREHVASLVQHRIGLQFDEKPWEQLRSIPVDREGEYMFLLRSQTSKNRHRVLCEVKVVDSVKVVTLRSTYKIENHTLYPLELMLVDGKGQPLHSLEKLAPGEGYSLPIDTVTQSRVRLQPDQGFGYRWCQAIRWEDLIAKRNFTITCSHADTREAPFRMQASVQMDGYDSTQRKYPKVNLKLSAPLELENLLPYNVDYRIYDKNTDQTWMSYLRKGAIMPVHSVELGHLLLLSVIVQDTVFKPSDFAIINTGGNTDYDVEHHLLLKDTLGRQLKLKLGYTRRPDSGGAFKVQLYSSYIVLNKTGLPFWVRIVRSTRSGHQDAAGEHREEQLSKPTPFLLSHFTDDSHEFTFRIDDSRWSKVVSLDAPSAEAELVAVSQKRKTENVHVGLSWTEGLGKYKFTKVITLSPRFLVKNALSTVITFREHGNVLKDDSILQPGSRCPLWFFRQDHEKLLTIAYPGLDAIWSPPVNVADIGVVYFRIRSQATTQVELVRADIRIDGATIFITLLHSANQWPYKIENDTDQVIKICQTSGPDEPLKDSDPVYTIPQRSELYYAWDYPAAKNKQLLLLIKGHRRVVDLREIGVLMPFRFSDNQRSRVVSLDIRAEGQMQVLRISPYNPERSVYKPRQRSSTIMPHRQESLSNVSDVFEAVPERISPTLTYILDIAGIGISVINKKLVEVVYVTITHIKFDYTNSPVAQSINLSCGSLQIDNQLHDALFPVVLQPTPIPKGSAGVAPLPTIQASVIWLNDDEHGVLFIKYCSILLQALTIEADEDLLFSLYDLSQTENIWEEGAEDVLLENLNELPEPPSTATGQELYFEVLELQPIMLLISFMRTERFSSGQQLSNKNPLAVVLNALTMTIGNVNDAGLEMNALAIKDMRLTMPELQNRVLYHYRQDILRQLYRILGSADFIGNPVGLFNNVSSGVADIFYEPFYGAVMRGNKDLGIGLAKGAASFVKKTVFGLSDSMTKFTSSIGKGLSAATFDSEYQARRRLNQRRNKPRHAIYGVAAGGEALANSVTSAVEGIVMKPIEGAETEGAIGFFKGIGKGLVGAVTKPVVGVFDLASNVSEGIRNTTTVFDTPERDRVRMPRLIPADGVLRPYSPREALGQYWMMDLNDGAYRQEYYIAHIQLSGAENIVLLTTKRVLCFFPKKLRLTWEIPFTEVQGVKVEDTGIRFAHKSGKEHNKFVPISDGVTQSWFFKEIAAVVKAFNDKRQMEC